MCIIYKLNKYVFFKHFLYIILGSSGQPSFGRLFKYPKFEIGEAIASKSFFQVNILNIF